MSVYCFHNQKKNKKEISVLKNSVYGLLADENTGSLSYSVHLLILLVPNWLTSAYRFTAKYRV